MLTRFSYPVLRLESVLALLDISHLQYRHFNSLPEGERQRVIIARAIIQEPDVLILDKPTLTLEIFPKKSLNICSGFFNVIPIILNK
ncbi:ATP-binding cassette domain-containing protein [Psychromonas sp. B3M02]|uniref:ATP-binding cassette domain-containing protein n=1 Tax=Psychromonas sp. B3M02 TaxID=2267226 RepID=UPI0034D9668F